MLSLDNHQQVEHPRVEFGVIVVLNHVEEVLGNAEVLLRMTYVQTAPLYAVAVDVVSVGDDCRELGYQLNRLPHEIVAADIVGIGVKGVHLEHTACEDIHDVRSLEVDDVHDGAVVEGHIVVEQLGEGL